MDNVLSAMSTSASQMSVAVAVKGTTVPSALACSIVTSSGTLRTGGVVSTTVIFTSFFVPFPESSVAVKVTVVVPRG